jgi:hypothetical protein
MDWQKDWLLKTKLEVEPIRKIIDQAGGTLEDISDKSTRGFGCQQFYLLNKKEKFNEVIEIVKDQLNHISKKSYKLLTAWTVLGQENNYHRVHSHSEPTNHVSTVLYLRVPENNFHQSGEFYYFLKEEEKIKLYSFAPFEGLLVIMPRHILHGTYPQAKGIRQTLNMDFEIGG